MVRFGLIAAMMSDSHEASDTMCRVEREGGRTRAEGRGQRKRGRRGGEEGGGKEGGGTSQERRLEEGEGEGRREKGEETRERRGGRERERSSPHSQ